MVTTSGGGDGCPLADLRPDRLDVVDRAQLEAVDAGGCVKGPQLPTAHPGHAPAGGEPLGKIVERRLLDAGITLRDDDRPAEGRPAQLHDRPGLGSELFGLLRPEARVCPRLRDLRAHGRQPRLLGGGDTGRRRADRGEKVGESVAAQRVHRGEGGALGLQVGEVVAQLVEPPVLLGELAG
ncbi:hypothetical protein [Protofrankia coriariae]|uniref:hypothetical protein n=1 Tax=Protofrankia coriariae TaxID=1562887 RepID=UPI0012F63847|nr:hypothetical protein [Protofrankia coriariae]